MDKAILHLEHFFGRGRPKTIYTDGRPMPFSYEYGRAISGLLSKGMRQKNLPWPLVEANYFKLKIKDHINEQHS